MGAQRNPPPPAHVGFAGIGRHLKAVVYAVQVYIPDRLYAPLDRIQG